ncbi:hypothetical protein [Pararhizobium sp. IMCC21322]|uniref:hypothetical protein n=1 Tax=Pararhizobium sp. IMCC21322 TaxID=3067903 RepID=UPI0027411D05|nr:hypothetical protein [Pararhizobium sp. IMCC21322]
MSPSDKIWLLDEVVSTATASWRIYIAAYDKFSVWPVERQDSPEYNGYATIRALLSHSFMSACYASVESGKRSYSMHHAINDPDLIVSPLAKMECENCLGLRTKIATYRNNVTAHVNTKRKQAEWANFANIKNGEIDVFLRSARTVVEELGKSNLGVHFLASSRMTFQKNFREFCRVMQY